MPTRLLSPPPPRPRVTPELLTQLAAHLTDRDRRLLDLLWEHHVLTSQQIAQIAFDHIRVATRRLDLLYRLRAIDRARPWVDKGSAPYHHVLDQAGAITLAASRGITVQQLGYRRDHTLAHLTSAQLGHSVGCNGVFTALIAHARANPQTELLTWWSARQCRNAWHGAIRPDGYGRWREHRAEVDFFLEYDTGTETITKVARKLDAYQRLQAASGIPTPILFVLPSHAREANLRAHINRTPLPVATGAPARVGDPINPAHEIWRPVSPAPGPGRLLADLAHSWPHLAKPMAGRR